MAGLSLSRWRIELRWWIELEICFKQPPGYVQLNVDASRGYTSTATVQKLLSITHVTRGLSSERSLRRLSARALRLAYYAGLAALGMIILI